MPDHQIVIKLDKDRFDEAQKMAKQAGYRSATSYIRKKVISILDKQEDASSSSSAISQEFVSKIQQLDGDLMRMQEELQVFISESEEKLQYGDIMTISEQSSIEYMPRFSDNLGATIDPKTDTTHTTTTEKQSPLSQESLIETSTVNDDETEKSVWRSISQNEESPILPEEDEDIVEEIETDTRQPSPINSQSNKNATNTEKSQETHIVHPSVPELEEVLNAVDEANDELEEMADRAFSISPRLGSFEETQGGLPIPEDDPLAELLDENLIEVMKSGDTAPLETRIVQHQEAILDNPGDPQELAEDDENHVELPIEDDSTTSASEQKREETPTDVSTYDDEIETEDQSSATTNTQDNLPVLESDQTEDQELDEDIEKHDLSSGPPPKRKK